MPLEDLFRSREALKRFRMAPLGAEMDRFGEWLLEQGYCRDVGRRQVRQVSHFNRYLRQRGLKAAREVDEDLAGQFVRQHLPRCRCGGGRRRQYREVPRSVRCFLAYLCERGLVVSLPPQVLQPPSLLEEFLQYLKGERGLAQRTIDQHRRYLVPFLEDLGVDSDRQALAQLRPEQVQAGFAHGTEGRGKSPRRRLQGILRNFFRFAHQQGYLQRDLAQAVPPIRSYQLSPLPRGLSDEQAQKVLACIDRTTAVGRRDFALLQLLYTYGVRGGQIRALRLQDLRWREQQIHFPAHKGGKPVRVPLTEEAGEALLEYLRQGRPHTAYPEVFLTAKAPIHPLTNASTVSVLVASRLRQSGIQGSPQGSHAFRFAFATRMLSQGQSLKTIADLLGHRHLNSSFIYTKVDLARLRDLPLQWPEEV